MQITKANRATIRKYALERGERYKINNNNSEIHIYGIMPNTNQVGWYFAGSAEEITRQIANEKAAA